MSGGALNSTPTPTPTSPFNSTHYVVLNPQNGDRIVTTDSVTSHHPVYSRETLDDVGQKPAPPQYKQPPTKMFRMLVDADNRPPIYERPNASITP